MHFARGTMKKELFGPRFLKMFDQREGGVCHKPPLWDRGRVALYHKPGGGLWYKAHKSHYQKPLIKMARNPRRMLQAFQSKTKYMLELIKSLCQVQMWNG